MINKTIITINAKCIILLSPKRGACDGLLGSPRPPVCRKYAVKLFLGFGVDPPADDPPTRKYESVFAVAVDNGELHIAIERSGIYWLPVHNEFHPPRTDQRLSVN
jgi:hypothetical protein